LSFLFSLSRLSVITIRSNIESQAWPRFTVGWGNFDPPDLELLETAYRKAKERYPVKIESPFEGSEFIAGGIWKDNQLDDAVVPLQFSAGCNDLPPHIHRYSDRLIVILNGRGRMHFSRSSSTAFSDDDFQSREIVRGNVMAFMRGAIHTFSTPEESLEMLSYHDPFIALDDPKQYEVVSQNGL
jgi:mannose-6-phosphate isomerase-like protein (cupin superfamily)